MKAFRNSLFRCAILGSAIVAATPAASQTRTDQNVLMSEVPGVRRAQDRYGFSDAVVAGDLIFLSGIVAGPPMGPGSASGNAPMDAAGMTAAFDRAYQQIGSILKRAGASYDDIVDITTYHTDVTAQIGPYVEVQKKYVKAPYPAWTAIDIDRLLPESGLAEIKIVARKPAKR